MNTCSYCRFWKKAPDNTPLTAYKGRGFCERIDSIENDPEAKALTLSAEESEFVTSPDFGCVLFDEVR